MKAIRQSINFDKKLLYKDALKVIVISIIDKAECKAYLVGGLR